MWFRRDLRLADNPALVEAARAGDDVLALYVIDPRLWGPAGVARQAFLVGCLRALDEAIGGRLRVRRGDPVEEVRKAAKAVDAASTFCAADFGPYGAVRDTAVAEHVELVRVGSP